MEHINPAVDDTFELEVEEVTELACPTTYDQFVRDMLSRVAAAVGMLYADLTGELEAAEASRAHAALPA